MLARHAWRRPLFTWLARCGQLPNTAREWYRRYEDVREERGIKLLREWLSTRQREQYDAFRHFDIIGIDSKKRYRIHHGSAQNVCELDEDGRPLVGWCFMPSGHLVAGDVMLAQKIAIETDERAALLVAQRFPATRRVFYGLQPCPVVSV